MASLPEASSAAILSVAWPRSLSLAPPLTHRRGKHRLYLSRAGHQALMWWLCTTLHQEEEEEEEEGEEGEEATGCRQGFTCMGMLPLALYVSVSCVLMC
ncbi:unnamed protein product [Boreogadus saida]